MSQQPQVETGASNAWKDLCLPWLGRMRDPGALELPLVKLLPFFSLWTMHVWIYWFNNNIRMVEDGLPWWLGIYGVMTLTLIAVVAWRLALAKRGADDGTSPVRGALDIPMTAAMCATTVMVGAAGLTGGAASAVLGTVSVVLAGICMAWGYLRWSYLYADLGIRDAVGCLFSSYLLGSTIKFAFDATVGVVGCVLALAIPVISLLSLRSAEATVAQRAGDVRGKVLYRKGSVSGLLPLAVCVLLFCLAMRLCRIAHSYSAGFAFNKPLVHIIEIVFAVAVLWWVFGRNRVLDFPQLWRFVFLFLSTTIVSSCVEGPAFATSLFSGVTTSLIVMLLWLLLSDVAHHSDLHPHVVFGLGWSLYVGAQYLGMVVTRAVPGLEWSPLMAIVLLWVLGVTMAFCLSSNSPDVHRVFADMGRQATPEEFASIDERCEQLAQERELTKRELDVLKLLAKGRSKGFIAEELYISENTVRGHARRLYVKLDVHTRDELQDLLGL